MEFADFQTLSNNPLEVNVSAQPPPTQRELEDEAAHP